MRRFLAKHSEFVSNVAILMSGRTIAAAIALFTIPIVARLFIPSDFGVAAMFASICGIVSSVATLHYGSAIVLPKDSREARMLMAFSFRVLLTVCVAILVALVIYQLSGATWPAFERLDNWKWALPFGILLMSSVEIQNSWLTRTKAFKTSSASLITGNVATTGSRIGLGAAFGSSIFALIFGYLFGLVCRIAVQQTRIRESMRETFQRMPWNDTVEIARRYSDFPRLNAPAGLLFSLGSYLPVLLFGAMFSPSIAGFYAMADRLSRVPVAIVAESMRNVFFQRAAKIRERGDSLRRAFMLSTGGLVLLGAPPCAVLWFFGQEMITWLLGARWFEAGGYLEVMAPWLLVLWVAAPCHPTIIVLRKQRIWLYLEAVVTVVRLATFAVAHSLNADSMWTLQAFVAVTVIGNLALILIVMALTARPSNAQH